MGPMLNPHLKENFFLAQSTPSAKLLPNLGRREMKA